MAELTHTDVDAILRILDQMQGREIHLEIGELKLHVTAAGESSAAPALPAQSMPATDQPAERPAAESAAEPAAPVATPPGHVAVRAPTMGTFFRAESPGAKPYAEVGDRVKAADVVGIFEVMKLFSTLTAGIDGTVTAFLVANETLVAQDQPLILIRPD
jgi:acetyl-CoA carboxylase biotin carboxyl carrier protein